jgi:hypothetical protein
VVVAGLGAAARLPELSPAVTVQPNIWGEDHEETCQEPSTMGITLWHSASTCGVSSEIYEPNSELHAEPLEELGHGHDLVSPAV